ncbi:MAG: disulfide bond formation protein B [Gammaproteobacteria bacterium]|nr:MAG: disulfide bond formation protein B [Gammaproteobacteria bacterium]
MWKSLACIGRSGPYWMALVVLSLAFEGVALYFQYVKETYPCPLCIHMRLWVAGLLIVALLVWVFRRWPIATSLGHLLVVALTGGMTWTAWRLLGTERGFLISDCGFDLGLPAWFAPDKWLPALFEVQDTCGYTPELGFGITMAEALIVICPLLFLMALAMLIADRVAGR